MLNQRRFSPFAGLLAAILAVVVILAGCGGGGSTPPPPPPTVTPSPTPAPSPAATPQATKVSISAPPAQLMANGSAALSVTVTKDPNFPNVAVSCSAKITAAPNNMLNVASVNLSPDNSTLTFNAGNSNPGQTTATMSCNQGNGPTGTASVQVTTMIPVPHLTGTKPSQIPNDVIVIVNILGDNGAMVAALPNPGNPTIYAGDQPTSNPQFPGFSGIWVDANTLQFQIGTHAAPSTGTPIWVFANPDPVSKLGGGLSNSIILGNGPIPPAAPLTASSTMVLVNNGGNAGSTAFVYQGGTPVKSVALGSVRVTNPVTLGNSVVIGQYETGDITVLHFNADGTFLGSETLSGKIQGHPVNAFVSADGKQVGFVTESEVHPAVETFPVGFTPIVNNKVFTFDGQNAAAIANLPENVTSARFLGSGVVFTDSSTKIGFADSTGVRYLQGSFKTAMLQVIDASHVAVVPFGTSQVNVLSLSGSSLNVDRVISAATDDSTGVMQITADQGQLFVTKGSGQIIAVDPATGATQKAGQLRAFEMNAGVTVRNGVISTVTPETLGGTLTQSRLLN